MSVCVSVRLTVCAGWDLGSLLQLALGSLQSLLLLAPAEATQAQSLPAATLLSVNLFSKPVI